jgi:hypothetical protein
VQQGRLTVGEAEAPRVLGMDVHAALGGASDEHPGARSDYLADHLDAYTAAAVSKAARETISDWLMAIAAPLLLGSLFLTWSHQLSPGFRARYGATAAIQGVPADPSAWQVYSAADILLALVAGGLFVVAMLGGRGRRRVLALALAVALAFVIHALSVPPTNGAVVFDPTLSPPGYTANPVSSGAGEVLALVALLLGAVGVALGFTTD